MSKTIKQWIDEMEDRELAKRVTELATEEGMIHSTGEHLALSTVLICSFTWDKTIEGIQYWKKVYRDQIEREEKEKEKENLYQELAYHIHNQIMLLNNNNALDGDEVDELTDDLNRLLNELNGNE